MAGKFDPYAELGVARTATDAEIAHAFRQRVRRHHPDTRELDDQTDAAASDLALRRAVAAFRLLRRRPRDPAVADDAAEASPPVDGGRPAGPALVRVTPVQWAPSRGFAGERQVGVDAEPWSAPETPRQLVARLLWLALRDHRGWPGRNWPL